MIRFLVPDPSTEPSTTSVAPSCFPTSLQISWLVLECERRCPRSDLKAVDHRQVADHLVRQTVDEQVALGLRTQVCEWNHGDDRRLATPGRHRSVRHKTRDDETDGGHANRQPRDSRRLNYPYPDCTLRPSDCEDLDVVNTLDGWGLQTRLSVPFSGAIDVSTVTSDSVFVMSLASTQPGHPPGGERFGVSQIVWDAATHTLHIEVDRLLDQHRRFALIVTKDVLTTGGKRVKKTEAFDNYATIAPAWYAAQLDEALAAAHALGVPPGHVVAASVFTTQTITSVMERIRDDIKAATPAPADFQLGPSGERSVFARVAVASITWRQQTSVNPPGFADTPLNLGPLQNIPNTIG